MTYSCNILFYQCFLKQYIINIRIYFLMYICKCFYSHIIYRVGLSISVVLNHASSKLLILYKSVSVWPIKVNR